MLHDTHTAYASLGTDYPETHACENCLHWRGDNEIHIQRKGYSQRVGLCSAAKDELDNSPIVEGMDKGLAVVFTPSDGRCGAFEMHPDVLAEMAAEAAHYASLDRDRLRDAWR